MSETKLKPCPFCGGEAVLIPAQSRQMWSVVKCRNSKCEVSAYTQSNTKRGAVRKWNRRTTTKETR